MKVWAIALVGAALAAALGLAVQDNRAAAQVDISGEWNVTFSGDISTFESCPSVISQSGNSVTISMACAPPLDSGSFSGTIDPSTGSLDLTGFLSGFEWSLTGTASPQRDLISAAWSIDIVPAFGQMTGTRKLPPPPPPTALGGSAELPDIAEAPLETAGPTAGAFAGIAVAITMGALAAGAAVWYLSRRWQS